MGQMAIFANKGNLEIWLIGQTCKFDWLALDEVGKKYYSDLPKY